jgi:hypothetical protein
LLQEARKMYLPRLLLSFKLQILASRRSTILPMICTQGKCGGLARCINYTTLVQSLIDEDCKDVAFSIISNEEKALNEEQWISAFQNLLCHLVAI